MNIVVMGLIGSIGMSMFDVVCVVCEWLYLIVMSVFLNLELFCE